MKTSKKLQSGWALKGKSKTNLKILRTRLGHS